ncbi:MAG: hypothetical protein FJ167_03450 [Gammaproteobacteria bacterium]|nr:hypothetical protein [Gammaproteobacteria bacterium]
MWDAQSLVMVGLALVTAIAWLVRIEGKVLAAERDLARIEAEQDSKMSQILSDIRYLRDRIDRVLEERK